jgi:hypothetical protein
MTLLPQPPLDPLPIIQCTSTEAEQRWNLRRYLLDMGKTVRQIARIDGSNNILAIIWDITSHDYPYRHKLALTDIYPPHLITQVCAQLGIQPPRHETPALANLRLTIARWARRHVNGESIANIAVGSGHTANFIRTQLRRFGYLPPLPNRAALRRENTSRLLSAWATVLAAGIPLSIVAHHAGLPPRVIRRRLHDAGYRVDQHGRTYHPHVTAHPRATRESVDRWDAVKPLLDAGVPIAAASAETGVPVSSIRYLIQRHHYEGATQRHRRRRTHPYAWERIALDIYVNNMTVEEVMQRHHTSLLMVKHALHKHGLRMPRGGKRADHTPA